jgi:two-component system, OmpR family, heavy metal sensor histidine kinase CusS
MSSKSDEQIRGVRRSWTRLGRGSITGRLTVLYTFSTVGMLFAATGFLYWVLVSDLAKADNRFLRDKLQVLRAILREHGEELEGLEEEVNSVGAYYIRVLDRSQHSLIETPDMALRLPGFLFPDPVGAFELPHSGVKRTLGNGRSYLLISAWTDTGGANADLRLLQVALDVTSEENLIAGYRRNLIIVLLGGIFLSAAIGIFVARRGLRPVKEITQTAEHITPARLHERIDPARWPKELIALATAFDQMLDRLQESFTRLSQFSADLAHELRTPINALMGEAEVALSRHRTPEEYRNVLESSLEEFGRLSRIIDGLLFLARAEAADRSIEKTRIDARKEIDAVVEFFEAMAEEQGIRVSCQGHANLPADPILFRRAVGNLLSNALQYTSSGGNIRISVGTAADHGVDIRVEDNGSGIAPEHLPKIFDRLYRADSARSQYPKGFGLGLSIVKSIMELHGGSVSIQSEPSKGTIVTLKFRPSE